MSRWQLRDPTSAVGMIALAVVALVVLSVLFSPQDAFTIVAVSALAAYVVRRGQRREK
ncbi:MAG: hypothetical protein M9891_02470 [Austwickia sp.]|nr:hypothetical protein [Actinomycetota bacterium]MCO5308155.1 hypothetical protein [Austwickia sp.]